MAPVSYTEYNGEVSYHFLVDTVLNVSSDLGQEVTISVFNEPVTINCVAGAVNLNFTAILSRIIMATSILVHLTSHKNGMVTDYLDCLSTLCYFIFTFASISTLTI